MNQEIKVEWIAALRSGNYKQGTGRLKVNSDYCCLGVLCDLAVKKGIITETQLESVTLFGIDRAAFVLPNAVKEWAGMESDNGMFEPAEYFINESNVSVLVECLSELNDRGASFLKIADVIEKKF